MLRGVTAQVDWKLASRRLLRTPTRHLPPSKYSGADIVSFAKNFLRLLSLLFVASALVTEASASTVSFNGTFTADNSTLAVAFTSSTLQNVTFSTTSYASGGFIPVLTLFSGAGKELDNFGSGISDASLSDTLAAGSYVLYLTEFPNVAINNLSDGFLFANSPTITGIDCSVPAACFMTILPARRERRAIP